jgi:hypothetical protein
MNLDKIINLINVQKFTWLHVMNNKNQKLFSYSASKEEASAESCIKALKEYYDMFPGVYTLHFKKHSTERNEDKYIYEGVGIGPVVKEVEKVVNIEEIEKRIEAKLRAEIKEDQKKAREAEEIKALKNEYLTKCSELDTVQGKFNHLIMGLFGPMLKNLNPTGTLAGTEQEKESGFSRNDIEEINNGLKKILSVMDKQTFVSFADYVYKNPDVIPTLKSFLK